jgi:N-acetylglucosamine-6-phosphate deacetylase
MVTKVNVPLYEAVAMATDTPAHAIGLTTKGQFRIGGDADFVVISPELEVLRTFVGGEEIFKERRSLTAV